jgi:formylglycine-generating enzyme required for sulfatase activity
MTDLTWITVPEGTVQIGSTLDDIERAVVFWGDKLLNPDYKGPFRSYLMKEYPRYALHISNFEISDVPVTNGMYKQFAEDKHVRLPESLTHLDLGGGDDHPVWGVTFHEAEQYCSWLSEQTGRNITLPSEPQWEYAARGSTTREYPWGDEWSPHYCNSFETGLGRTSRVRKYENGQSYFGLYDMGGNVEEWVTTRYTEHPGGEYVKDDLYDALGKDYQILKGGSFARGGDLCRVARRHGPFPAPEFRFTGFRIVRT